MKVNNFHLNFLLQTWEGWFTVPAYQFVSQTPSSFSDVSFLQMECGEQRNSQHSSLQCVGQQSLKKKEGLKKQQ